MSGSKSVLFENLKMFVTSENISEIKARKKGQNPNQLWYKHKKIVKAASRAHTVFTKMKQKKNDKRGSWICKSLGTEPEDIRLIFCESRYGRNFESEAINNFIDTIFKDHKNFALEKCELIYVSFVYDMKERFISHCNNFYLKTFFAKRLHLLCASDLLLH